MQLRIESLGKRYQKGFWALREFTLECGLVAAARQLYNPLW